MISCRFRHFCTSVGFMRVAIYVYWTIFTLKTNVDTLDKIRSPMN